MKKSNLLFWGILGFVFVLLVVILVLIYFEMHRNSITYHGESEDSTFSTSFIRESHKKMKHKNYMVSPYSVEIALSMLREGTDHDTKEELDRIVPERKIKTLNVYDRVNVANALFIKDIYKQDVLSQYTDIMKSEYNAEILYDKFQTPDVINNWAKRETNGMIKKVVDSMDPQFVIGLANAVAMEEDWKVSFDCKETKGYAFTKIDGSQFDTSMMFQSYEEDVSYFKYQDTEGVVIPYQIYDRVTGKEAEEGEQLDFVGILPKDMDQFLKTFDMDYLESGPDQAKQASEQFEVYVGLPRFEFDYDFKNFKNTLQDMGIQKVFTDGADFSLMLQNHEDVYVSDAVHKTYVKVNEKGTKAAAVTYFGLKDNAMPAEEKEYVSVIFDKPFAFIIKDHNSHEILFFGVVYEPEKWDATKSCD